MLLIFVYFVYFSSDFLAIPILLWRLETLALPQQILLLMIYFSIYTLTCSSFLFFLLHKKPHTPLFLSLLHTFSSSIIELPLVFFSFFLSFKDLIVRHFIYFPICACAFVVALHATFFFFFYKVFEFSYSKVLKWNSNHRHCLKSQALQLLEDTHQTIFCSHHLPKEEGSFGFNHFLLLASKGSS